MEDLFPDTVVPLKKQWLPSDYLEETIPALEDSPDGWVRAVDGKFYMRDWADVAATDLERPLSDGQIVNFTWSAELASGTVKVILDDHNERKVDLSINLPTPPEGTHMLMWDGFDSDTQSDELDTFAEALEPGEESDVEFYVWSIDIPFTFQAGTFVPTPASTPEAA